MSGQPLSSLRKTSSCYTKKVEKKCDKPCDTKPKAHSHCDDSHHHGHDDSHHHGHHHHGHHHGKKGYGLGGGWFLNLVIWFIIIAVIVWFILVSTKPTWVQKTVNGVSTGEVDQGKALLWAVIISLIITVIIWLIRYGVKI